jgi:hypothetical protein
VGVALAVSTPSTNFKFEPNLSRIEVHRRPNPDPAMEPAWSLFLYPGEYSHVLMGILYIDGPKGTGQALALAMIDSADSVDAEIEPEVLRDWASIHCVEVIYDICRRALEAQAAQMDFSFTLPIKSPESEVKIILASEGEDAAAE